MLYVDREIKEFVRNGSTAEMDLSRTAIQNADESRVTNVGYDLAAKHIYKEAGKPLESYTLQPGESVFIEAKEHIYLSSRTVGIVAIRNGRLRMGLHLDAPVYQPGHKTPVFFRLTNVTDKKLKLYSGEEYAMIMFYQLNAAPDETYKGAFQSEFQFDGMGDYNARYAEQIQELDDKARNLKDIEKNLYTNVLTILTIFIGIFTLLNVNIELAKASMALSSFLSFNLAVIGALSFLCILLDALMNRKTLKSWLWLIPGAVYVLLALCCIFL